MKLNPSMRLKVKRDTSFLPDPGKGVYFRNNTSSFQMKGNSIDQWVEKLIPMFNGKYTLEKLTDGLPGAYRDRVYVIAEVLFRNGFVQDVSKDRPHQLPDQVLEKHASQIEFLQNSVDSGAYRFQTYRQAKVLAIGSGPFLVSLISSLLESGLPKFHVLIAGSVPTNRIRIEEIVVHAQKTDSEVEIEVKEISRKDEGIHSWRDIVQQFDSILYVSQESNVEKLRDLHKICRAEGKLILPALCLQQVGLAGPLVHPDSEGCFESAWRSIHRSVFSQDKQEKNDSSTAGALLANVIVFELFKKITGVTKLEQTNQFFLLDLNTLEGKWHSFMPHPLVTGRTKAKWVEDFDVLLKQRASREDPDGLLYYFSSLTSEESGIFHILDEGDLMQLPLSQCRVETVDPLSEGPADLLPSIVCSELTHKMARREAGLTGIEAYVSRMSGLLVKTLPHHQKAKGSIGPREFVGIGAGETFAEAVCRGLHKCLTEEQNKRHFKRKNVVSLVELSAVDDELCQYYLRVLTTTHGAPIIGLGKEVFGFPVVWIGTNGRWYASVGLNTTLALQNALHQALKSENKENDFFISQTLESTSPLFVDKEPQELEIQTSEGDDQSSLLQYAMQVSKQNHKRISIFEVVLEPILQKELLGVYGVLLREEESM